MALFEHALPDARPRPFNNPANYCFINASLQALFAIPIVRRDLEQLCQANADTYAPSSSSSRTAGTLWEVAMSANGTRQEGEAARELLDQDRLAVTYRAAFTQPCCHFARAVPVNAAMYSGWGGYTSCTRGAPICVHA